MPDQHRNRITVILDPGTLGASRIAGTLEKGPCDPLGIATRFRGQEPIEHFITEDVEESYCQMLWIEGDQAASFRTS